MLRVLDIYSGRGWIDIAHLQATHDIGASFLKGFVRKLQAAIPPTWLSLPDAMPEPPSLTISCLFKPPISIFSRGKYRSIADAFDVQPIAIGQCVRLWVLLHGLRLGNLLRQLASVRRILETWHSSSFTGFFPPLIASHCSIGFRTRRVRCATTSELIWNMCFVAVLLPGHSESHCVVFFSLCSRMSRLPSPYCLLPSFLVCLLLQPPLLLYGRLLLFSGNTVSIYRYIV